MTELEKLLYRELYKKSFYDFVKDFWSEADPSKLVDGKLIQFYCECFQYMCKDWVGYDPVEITLPTLKEDDVLIDIRQNKRNLCLNVPPRHSKSMIFNVLGPTWAWLNAPVKAASVSHTGSLATEMNTKRHRVLNSDKFNELFDIKLVTNSRGKMVDNRGAEMYSINRNAFTGYGGDMIINDDLTNAETARKDQAEMNNAWSYYQNTMPSRINDLKKCFIMNIQQRLAPNDITGHIMNDPKLAETYIFVVLPAIFEHDTYVVCPISGDVLFWKKGDTLWPERFGNYDALRYQVGESVFETQYQQHPVASDKAVIKEEMIIEKDLPDTPGIEHAHSIYSSHDFPVKDKDSSDFLGSILAYKVGSTVYIIDCLEKKMAFKKSVEYVTALDNLYPGIIQIIEDKANGSPILQQLQDEVAGLQAFQPGTASKTQRLESASLYISNVVFVRTVFNKLTNTYELSEALQNLKRKLKNFPFLDHDDIVDAFSMLLLFIFMDKRYMVYGRSFTDKNIINIADIRTDYSTIFFNREGDTWKALDIAVQYGAETKLVVKKEIRFKASVDEGLAKLKEFGCGKAVYIDCSATEAINGMYAKHQAIERYTIEDFDQSVAQLDLAFSKSRILVDTSCVLTKSDILNFKYSKSKDENVKYVTTKDGFVACLRIAMRYYGGFV